MNQKTLKAMLHFCLITALVLISSSILLAASLEPLKKDKFNEKKFQSVLFGRLHIESAITRFNNHVTGRSFVLTLFEQGSDKRFLFPIYIKSKTDRFDEGDVKGYDTSFAAEAEAGLYILGYGQFKFDRIMVDKFATFVGNVENYYMEYFYINLIKGLNIPDGSLVYAGNIEITIHKVDAAPGPKLDLDYDVQYNFDDFEKDLQAFQEKYPKIYERFKDNVVQATWVDLRE